MLNSFLIANLNSTTQYYSNCFKCKMSNKEMVDDLLTIDPKLRDCYTLYQSLLFTIQQKNPSLFTEVLNHPPIHISEYFKTAMTSLTKHLPYVLEMMNTSLTNGLIEGINSPIKVIKRIAFGYGSF